MADKLDKTNVNNIKDASNGYKAAEKAVEGMQKGVNFLDNIYQDSLPKTYLDGYNLNYQHVSGYTVNPNNTVSYIDIKQLEITASFKTVEAQGTVASLGKMIDADNLATTKSWANSLPDTAKSFGALGKALDYGAKALDAGLTAEAGMAQGKSFGHALTGAVADVAIGAVFDLGKFGIAMEEGAKYGAMAGATGGGLVTGGNPVGVAVGGIGGGFLGAGAGLFSVEKALSATGLDGDGVELVDASAGAQYDTNDDGMRERLGWAGRDDGLLAIDLDGDGKITGAKELSFALHTAEEGDTDLQGLAKVFDSNKDGVLDRNDTAFDKFRIWQDKDGDGVSDAGEVKTLADMGIKSIGVISDGKAYMDAGNTVHGTASYTKLDGTTANVGDVDFKIAGPKDAKAGSKPTASNNNDSDEDGDDEDFDRNAKNALTGKIPTRLPEMSTSGGSVAMAAAMGIAAVEASSTNYARAA